MAQNASVFFDVLSVGQQQSHFTCENNLSLWQPGFELDLLHAPRILCHRVNPAWKLLTLEDLTFFLEQINEKNIGISIQKRFSRDCSKLNNLALWKNTDFKGKFSKCCMDQQYVQQLSIQTTIKNYITPVVVLDRPKSKFCSLESQVSRLNSALS